MKKMLILLVPAFLAASARAEIVDWTLITIDNQAISYGEYLRTYTELKANAAKVNDPAMRSIDTTNVLDLLINSKILNLEARKKEIDVNEKDVDQRIEAIKKNNSWNDEIFRQVLKQQGLTEKELRKNIREQIRNERLQDLEIRHKVRPPSEEEMRKFYNEHKAEMKTPEKVLASHILFPPMQETASLNEQVALKKRITEAHAKLKAGENFATVAKQYSIDEASLANGGSLGWVERGMMVPEFEEVLFKLKKGAVSDPFPSRYGIHIVKVFDLKKPEPISFEEAKQTIKPRLMQKSLETEFMNYIREKRKLYGIRIQFNDGSTWIYTSGSWKETATGKTMTQNAFYKFLSAKLPNG
jgi:parvulin-like peptidyl-prolyl isomerase